MTKFAGSVVQRKDGSWWARVNYVDLRTGKRRDFQRRAETKADARDRMHKLIDELENTDGLSADHARKTFSDLCKYYKKHYARPAEYVGER